jgi:hypothetical protein
MPNTDSQSAAAADELYKLERDGFAWECLRRNTDYRKDFSLLRDAASTADGKAAAARLAAWGLCFRVRPGASGRPGPGSMAARFHPNVRHSRTVTTGIPQHRQA